MQLKNELSKEKSIHLLQHSKGPIHWQPYSEEIIQEAKNQNKPIFISFGYSSCHWCHVMRDTSFSDSETASILNDNFICIKVDKDEYPDLGNYFLKACKIVSKNSGWPLNAFTLPDFRIFFAGTYFPLETNQHGMSFKELVKTMVNEFKNNFIQLETNATSIASAIQNSDTQNKRIEFEGHFPHPLSILDATKKFRDITNGGYGAAPKFHNFSFWEWTIEQIIERIIHRQEDIEHTISTIEKICMGGIVDQLRGGIHRYSTDATWLIPHFEKMLYDQASMLKVLAKVSLIYPSPQIFDLTIQTIDYLEYEMLSDKKYFMSSQDSDSENLEGIYFVFSEEEFETALKNDDDSEGILQKNLQNLKKWFGVDTHGNYTSDLSVLSLSSKYKNEFVTQENWPIIRKAKAALLKERKDRIPPQTDSKGISGHNFLIISALVDVFQFSRIDAIKGKAQKLIENCLESIVHHFVEFSKDSKIENIKHSTTNDLHNNLFEDFVFFAESQLRIYEISGENRYKDRFIEAMNIIVKKFIQNDLVYSKEIADNINAGSNAYPNQEVDIIDKANRSPLATFISLYFKAVLIGSVNSPEAFDDNNIEISQIIEKAKQNALKTPINAGEALRVLSYPQEAYRIISIPTKWRINKDFIDLIPYFMPRFVITYNTDDNNSDEWQICNMNTCELKGNGFNEFKKILIPDTTSETQD